MTTPADKTVDGELRERFTEYFDDLYQQWSIYGKYDKDKVVELLLNFIARQVTAARVGEVLHRYVNLVLSEPDEFKWKKYAEERIAELQNGATE